ncbi:MAG: leucyl aminopeptidase [Candidatus Cloacimonetes bacterium 4572_55]|nr:MAG: leucyl aminopeptidase [Candidatus Cloacimonetes bacterium 4572_55]
MLTKKNFEIFAQPCSQVRADLLVALNFQDVDLYRIDHDAIKQTVHKAKEGMQSKKFKRDFFTALGDGAPAKFLLVKSAEQIKMFDRDESARITAASISNYAENYGCGRVAILLNGLDGANFVQPVVQGLIWGSYKFNKYFKEKKNVDFQVDLIINPTEKDAIESALYHALVSAESVNLARDMVNEPSETMTPEAMAQAAKEIAKEFGLKCKIFDEKQLQKHNYNCLLAVGRGGANPPRMITLDYHPKKSKTDMHLGFVGKGITFDTGGVCLKPGSNMWAMKSDMGGAAAVLYAMKIIGELAPSHRVTGIIAAAENSVDATAQHPGNILKAKNGKSIHVDNTDAEGRLVLVDGLAHAGEEGVTHLIDIATLTGACVVALGGQIAGVMGDDDMTQAIIRAGSEVGEKYWRLPLPLEYRKMLDIPIADINNMGGREGSSLLAGLFLKEFVPENVKWAHIDIAGPSFTSKKWKYFSAKSGTGFGVRTLVEIVRRPELITG